MTRRSLGVTWAFVLFGGLCISLGISAVACGGNDKPPLTPDNTDSQQENLPDGSTPPAVAPAPPSK